MNTQETSRITNRHIAQLLDDLEALCRDMPSLAKVAVKRQMRFLSSDIEQATRDNAGKNTWNADSSNFGDEQ